MSAPLDAVASIKVKLGLLVVASVVAAALLTMLGSAADVSPLLVLPVSVALALGVTQLLAAGMVAPLRQMTDVTRAMARGDYSGRVVTSSTDEVGQLAAAFNQMAEDLATVDRERRELIATVSHELRTPLTAMSVLLENLADGVVAPDRDHLAEALEQAQRLGALVGDLLELSRLEAGVVELDVRPTMLRSLVEDCVAQVRAAGRTAAYDVHVPDDLVLGVDPARLRQLLVNVHDNAGRHTPAGMPARISAGSSAGVADDAWWLDVADAGPGVAPGDRERVFERFGTDDGGGGTGLGLAVARWVAQLHGGTLRFIDPPSGTGACLHLEVPIRPSARPALDPTHAPTPVEEIPVTTPTTTTNPASPTARPAALDVLFGRFWPERGHRSVCARCWRPRWPASSRGSRSPSPPWGSRGRSSSSPAAPRRC